MSTLQPPVSATLLRIDQACAVSSLEQSIASFQLTLAEAYEFGKDIGQQEYHQFATGHIVQKENSLENNLLVLMDWWSRSYLVRNLELIINNERSLDQFIEFKIIHKTKKTMRRKNIRSDCPFIAGLFAGFISGLSKTKFEAIEIDSEDGKNNTCRFLLGHKVELNAIFFWQTLDNLSR